MGLEGGLEKKSHYEHLTSKYDRLGRSIDSQSHGGEYVQPKALAEEKIAELLPRTDTFTELAWAIEGELPELSKELQRKCAEAIRVLKTERVPENPFSGAMAAVFNEQLERVNTTATKYLERFNVENPLPMKNGDATTVHEIIQEKSSTEAVICPGSLTGPLNIKEFCKNMALKGYSVTTPEIQRRAGGEQKAETEVLEGYAQSVEAAIDRVLTRNPNAEIELVGFSSGAAAVVEAARRHPGAIKKVVLLNPIGIAGVDKTYFSYLRQYIEIAKRSLWDHSRQLSKAQLTDKERNPQYAGFADWFSRQWKRGLSELPALLHTAATVNLLPQIVELESKGIPVEIIATEDDKLFPLEEVQETLKALRGIVDDRLLPLTGIHTKIGAEPGALASMIAFSRDTVYKDEVPVEIKDETPRRDPR